MPTPWGTGIDVLYINTIRMLAMDAVQQANPGHAGTTMERHIEVQEH